MGRGRLNCLEEIVRDDKLDGLGHCLNRVDTPSCVCHQYSQFYANVPLSPYTVVVNVTLYPFFRCTGLLCSKVLSDRG